MTEKRDSIHLVGILVLVGFFGCRQAPDSPPAATSGSNAADVAVDANADKSVVDATIPARTVDQAMLPQPVKAPKVVPKASTPKPRVARGKTDKKACREERRMQERTYQKVLKARRHRRCHADSDCILLPATTQCGQSVCLHESGAANKKYAKKVKAVQYNADLKTCPSLTRQCEPALHAKRIQTRCKAKHPLEARCVESLCVSRPKVKKVVPRKTGGGMLMLGDTIASDRRFKMAVSQSLMFGRNAAFESCTSHGGDKSGMATFEFTVSKRGALSSLRIKSRTVPKRMALCLRTWLKGHTYPKPKSGAVTVTQSVRYVAR